MPCKTCEKDPEYHNFLFVERTKAGDGIFYTCPAKGKERKPTEQSVKDYIEHMDEASISSWIWIFDCKGLEKIDMPSLRVLQLFTELVQERYKFILKNIYILHPNWRMQMMLTAIRPFLKKETQQRFIMCDSPLHLFQLGITSHSIQKYIQ